MRALSLVMLWIGGMLIGISLGMAIGKATTLDLAVNNGVAHHDSKTGTIIWDKVVCNESGN